MPNKKKKIRNMRKGIYRANKGGGKSSHLMDSGQDDKGHTVYPTIFPKKKNPSTKPKDWKELEGKEF